MVVVVIDLYVVQDGFDGHLARGLARTEWFASDSPMCLVSHLPDLSDASFSCSRCEAAATFSTITRYQGKAPHLIAHQGQNVRLALSQNALL